MLVPDAILRECRKGGEFETLEPVPRVKIDELKIKFPNLPQQYLYFLEHVGEGVTRSEYCIFQPFAAEEYYDIPEGGDFLLPGPWETSGLPEGMTMPPRSALVFAPSGGAWDYCFSGLGDEAVFTLDVTVPLFSRSYDDFFSYVSRLTNRTPKI
ncbi:hypothetical protein [Labrenzia sp. VG12]|uniref:hypothetical protein n=1 Tax=Labrenzia sp. VG12 TaxID=2021862 RepID=UPI000B8C423E|nr:hypothetical protein [Labrenzia sp. VG12]ASP33448.1 hypothetical protein CHH27_09480 [Labrenzia sp. VG12]